MANGTRKPMRQGQQNRRGRGRGRKPQGNNLSRNLESNGPDVKIRGTAAHIAEKYATLARDALSSGDTVAGESYLQHAEHYNRIIMANQQAQQAENASSSSQPRERSNGADEATDRQQAEAASQADQGNSQEQGSSKSAQPEEISENNGLARTMARTVRRKTSNGAKSGDSEDGDSEPSSDGGDAEESKDEAVT